MTNACQARLAPMSPPRCVDALTAPAPVRPLGGAGNCRPRVNSAPRSSTLGQRDHFSHAVVVQLPAEERLHHERRGEVPGVRVDLVW
jgi:hypothetical protein